MVKMKGLGLLFNYDVFYDNDRLVLFIFQNKFFKTKVILKSILGVVFKVTTLFLSQKAIF